MVWEIKLFVFCVIVLRFLWCYCAAEKCIFGINLYHSFRRDSWVQAPLWNRINIYTLIRKLNLTRLASELQVGVASDSVIDTREIWSLSAVCPNDQEQASYSKQKSNSHDLTCTGCVAILRIVIFMWLNIQNLYKKCNPYTKCLTSSNSKVEWRKGSWQDTFNLRDRTLNNLLSKHIFF